MTSKELRQKFLKFFENNRHAIIPSASLIPENDPTVLFTTAGMHPLIPYILGEKHPEGKRLTNSQKCIRTTDIDDVGDNRHLTFFEMLGNWSLGDYFKKEALSWSWEFLTNKKYLGIDPKRLYVTVFMGNENSDKDRESINTWKELFSKSGIDAEICPNNEPIAGNKNYRIFPLPAEDNWWGPAGQTGPCGPCSEIFYDVAPGLGTLQKKFSEEVDDFRIMEIWNDVFMEFNKTKEGSFEKLAQRNVDTGMGLERTISVLNGKKDSFDNELFYPIFEKIGELSGKKYGESEEVTKIMRIVADHIKASTFLLAENLEPSNVERGYILRRLIRRAVRYGKQLGIKDIFTSKIAEVVVDIYKDIYPEVYKNKDFIFEQLKREEEKFSVTLERGLKELKENTESWIKNFQNIPFQGGFSFLLYESYGFPPEMTLEELRKYPEVVKQLDEKSYWKHFNDRLKEHQELSRAGAEQKFKGGLADNSEQTTKYHTATHLLLAAMRQLLSNEIYQKGSNITAKRLRFDFNYPQKLKEEQIKQIENLVNEKIQEDIPVEMIEMPKDEALKIAKISFDPSKYGDIVKVYKIGDFSIELCGGPHVERTKLLGNFKIIKEESSSAGVRRIKAILN